MRDVPRVRTPVPSPRPGVRVLAGCLALAGAGCFGSHVGLADDESPDGTSREDAGHVEGDGDAGSGTEDGPADDVAVESVDAEDPTDEAADGRVDGADAEDDGGAPDDSSDACPGGWYDPSTGRCWEDTASAERRDWRAATEYCDALSADGLPAGSWRLPTISELRSLIRGCPSTETGGSCRVTDSCLAGSCTSAACSACDYLGGPGTDGCYWDVGVEGVCTWYWSSSTFAGSSYYAWVVDFYDGSVYSANKTNSRSVRCVRAEP
ncbi:MAG: DUF1566 domain-containing protein [Deltaproteobacteria bacterium]|nr:DUF1566 domain-containing protein [Deltaproteobacteria bacterium]